MKVLIIFVMIAIASLNANPAKPVSEKEAERTSSLESINRESDVKKHRNVRSHHRMSGHHRSHQPYYAPAESEQYNAPMAPLQQQYYGPMAPAQQQYYAAAEPASAASSAAPPASASTEAPKAASPKKSALASKFLKFFTTFVAALMH